MESGKGTVCDSRHPSADTLYLSADRILCRWNDSYLGAESFPPFSLIHLDLVEYIFLPGLMAWFFTKQLLDGKAPHRFLFRIVDFHLSPHLYNRYKEISDSKKPYKYASKVSYRQLSYYERGTADEHRVSD
nr:hypothetical protein P5652_22500 [Bacillus subtilis]